MDVCVDQSTGKFTHYKSSPIKCRNIAVYLPILCGKMTIIRCKLVMSKSSRTNLSLGFDYRVVWVRLPHHSSPVNAGKPLTSIYVDRRRAVIIAGPSIGCSLASYAGLYRFDSGTRNGPLSHCRRQHINTVGKNVSRSAAVR